MRERLKPKVKLMVKDTKRACMFVSRVRTRERVATRNVRTYLVLSCRHLLQLTAARATYYSQVEVGGGGGSEADPSVGVGGFLPGGWREREREKDGRLGEGW